MSLVDFAVGYLIGDSMRQKPDGERSANSGRPVDLILFVVISISVLSFMYFMVDISSWLTELFDLSRPAPALVESSSHTMGVIGHLEYAIKDFMYEIVLGFCVPFCVLLAVVVPLHTFLANREW